jgi:hypothetical protein
VAGRKHMPYQTLVKMLIAEGLDRIDPPGD